MTTGGPARVRIGRAAVDVVTMDEAVQRILEWAQAREVGRYVVTPNVDHVMRLEDDADFRGIYDGADLVLADGMPLVWASRLLRAPLPERVAGSDLFVALCAAAAEVGVSVYFLGGNPGDAAKARDVLCRQHPTLQVAGVCCPPFGFDRDVAADAQIAEQVRQARPDVLFVGLGSPKQERWICRHVGRLGVPVSIGVGVSFSFVAGTIRRAPRWVQRVGMEWSWRLSKEPGRLWRRYLITDMGFWRLVFREARSQRRRARRADA